ncbi:hypothetical protein [Kitasatospora brasiliensis]|uniref:hypothetical protein n=1 Tax=Kitasatospora brasiliensis TaxID=3058040 RepID=UPI00292D7E6B|nr:hypothetical protein [Kitasatospora sp. K002]
MGRGTRRGARGPAGRPIEHWFWGVVGACCGIALWWAVVELLGGDQDAWWAVMGRVFSVTGGLAAGDRLRSRWG